MEKFYKGIGRTFIFLAAGLLMGFPSTWFCMIALGILHHHWPVIPALGYWETYVLYVALNMAGQAIKTGIKPAAGIKAG